MKQPKPSREDSARFAISSTLQSGGHISAETERLLRCWAEGQITDDQLIAAGLASSVDTAALETVVADGIAAIEQGDFTPIHGREGTKALLERLNARRSQRLAATIDAAARDLAEHGPVTKPELGKMLTQLEEEWQPTSPGPREP